MTRNFLDIGPEREPFAGLEDMHKKLGLHPEDGDKFVMIDADKRKLVLAQRSWWKQGLWRKPFSDLYVQCKAQLLPFDDASMDFVVMGNVLNYFVPETQAERTASDYDRTVLLVRKNIIKECVRVLKPRGDLVVWHHHGIVHPETYEDTMNTLRHHPRLTLWNRFRSGLSFVEDFEKDTF